MESYIADPEIHAECVKNPALKGGPFIDLDGDQSVEVAELLEKNTSHTLLPSFHLFRRSGTSINY